MSKTAEPRVGQAAPVTPPEHANGGGAAEPRRRVKRAFTATHLIVTGLAGLVSVMVSLLFQVAPGLRPDPGDNVGADVAVIALEPGATVGSWINRGAVGAARERLRRAFDGQLEFGGEIIFVHVAVDGHKHKDVSLRYRLYEARTHRRASRRLGFAPFATVGIDAPRQRSVQLMFVPDLKREQDLFVRVELSDSNGLLAVADSERISRGRLQSQ